MRQRGEGHKRRRPGASAPGAALLVASLASVASVAGCGYSLVGRTSTLPPSIRVVQFQTLANQTSRVGVEQRLSREIARELASRGRFAVQAQAAGADAALIGAVIGFDLYAVAFDESGRAREYQVRITVRVSLKSTTEDKVI
ncbi:MAG TPA: LPS assembly lipoprotein LptE, partial [Thermoanaerobaculia bacterium]|nr:LPS assembly lipoprotein LptE [Thermoanaerobaculia bacterium]